MDDLLNTIKIKASKGKDKYETGQLIQGFALLCGNVWKKRYMTEDEVTDMCSCLLLLYSKQGGNNHEAKI